MVFCSNCYTFLSPQYSLTNSLDCRIDFDEYQSTNKHPLIADILSKVKNIKKTNGSKNDGEFFEDTMNSVIPGRKPFKIYK